MPRAGTVDEFWASVDVRGPDECWEWTGCRLPIRPSGGGYGITGKAKIGEAGTTTAHRVAFILTYGPVPAGHDICHHCDNPPCCNPAHLFDGTTADNMQDCLAKGRRNDAKRAQTRIANHPTCPAGHPYDITKDGHRSCSECRRLRLGGAPERQRPFIPKTRKRRTKTTDEEIAEMKRRHAEGESFAALAEHYQLGVSTVTSMVNGHGTYAERGN